MVINGEKAVANQRHINQRLALLLPDVRMVEIRGASHLLHEDQPEEVARAVMDFVSRRMS